jgi:hypothetical protein
VLFTNDQRRRILAGEMTATIRAWQAPQVKAGKRYRFDDDHELVIHAVDLTGSAALFPSDLAAAGFESRAAFEAALPKFANDRPQGPFFVVRFALEPRRVPPPAPPADIEKFLARLDKLDRLSDHGPWTRDALRVIAANPRVVSTRLAELVGRSGSRSRRTYANSRRWADPQHDVGYEITPLGHQVLASIDDRISPSPAESGEGQGGEGVAGPLR